MALDVALTNPAPDGTVSQPLFTAEWEAEFDESPVTQNDFRYRIAKAIGQTFGASSAVNSNAVGSNAWQNVSNFGSDDESFAYVNTDGQTQYAVASLPAENRVAPGTVPFSLVVRVQRSSVAQAAAFPDGVLFPKVGTHASVTGNWSRKTSMDGRYAKGIATAATNPNTTGGSSTHSHSPQPHDHDLSHGHSLGGNTGWAQGTNSSHARSTRTAQVLTTPAAHSHTLPASLDTRTVSSATASPNISSESNEQPNLEVIWTESNGDATTLPAGTLFFYSLSDTPSGATPNADAVGRFLKGAATSQNGGTLNAGNLNHGHTAASHPHNGANHWHPATSGQTGSASAALAAELRSGSGEFTGVYEHIHTIEVGTTSTGSVGSASATIAASGDVSRPPWIGMRVLESDGSVEATTGVIGGWLGTLGTIPEGWVLCDGSNGTPNLSQGRYILGVETAAEVGTTGGSASGHGHTGGSHNHPSPSQHRHLVSISNQVGGGYILSLEVPIASMATTLHSHSSVYSGYTTPTVGAASITLNDAVMDPPHRTMAYIMCTPTSPVEDEVVRLFVSGSPVGPNKAAAGVWGTNETVAYTWTADELEAANIDADAINGTLGIGISATISDSEARLRYARFEVTASVVPPPATQIVYDTGRRASEDQEHTVETAWAVPDTSAYFQHVSVTDDTGESGETDWELFYIDWEQPPAITNVNVTAVGGVA